jgi:outer membrane protein assembly factor BamB
MVDTIPYLSYRMKRSKVLVLAVIASLPLVLVSCIGATQPTGGWSGPTVNDGIVYVGTRDGRVVAINASSREEQWQWPDTAGLRGLIYATPIVHGDLVYVGTYNGQVYALTSDRGVERWVYPRTGSIGAIVGTPVVVNDTIYVSSSDSTVYALDTTYGDPKPQGEYEILDEKGQRHERLWTSPVVHDGIVYVSTLDGYIYGLSIETGEQEWSFKSEAGFASAPVIYEDTIFLGSFDRYLYAIKIGSNVSMWKFPGEAAAGNWFWASPIVSEGIVYAGCLDGKLYAIEAETGEELWEFDAAGPIVSSPVLMDNLLLAIDESGTMYVFDISAESGDEAGPLKAISIGASVRSPFCAQDGLAYIRAEDNQLYVVDIDKAQVSWTFDLTGEQ